MNFKMEDIYKKFETRLCSYLNYLISIREIKTYAEVVEYCEIPSPRKIRKLNELLLKITEEDIKGKKPLRSALIVSKIEIINGARIPNEDFFRLLKYYSIYRGKNDKISIAKFHERLIQDLFT